MEIGPAELRVLGCLLEKQRTTPDQYPLTLNALRLACNQSTNRDPVVAYDDATVRDAAQRLGRLGWCRLAAAGRAPKYRHLLGEALGVGQAELAVLCVLLLRGAQTPGELKQRTERLHPFADLAAIEATLDGLIDRELVARIARRPGQKEDRFAQLLGGDDPQEGSSAWPAGTIAPVAEAPEAASEVIERGGDDIADALGRELPDTRALLDRIAALEDRLADVERRLDDVGA